MWFWFLFPALCVPAFCAVLRTLVGADAAALFWLDAQGRPEGFFHEDSPAGAQDLFLNEFDRLFAGRTRILISHRPSTLADADLRFELLDGVLISKAVLHEA